jgi:hypothetical protein
MHKHRYYGPLGRSPDMVKHEVGHAFGLDDKHEGESIGKYYVPGGVMDKGELSGRLQNTDPTRRDVFGIRPEETSMIMRFVHDYNPAMKVPRTRAFIPHTPEVTFTHSIVPGQSFGTMAEALENYQYMKSMIESVKAQYQDHDARMREWVDQRFGGQSAQPAPTP